MTDAVLDSEANGARRLEAAWAWWRAQRLTFNLCLGAAGGMACLAYAIILRVGFHRPPWLSLGSPQGQGLYLLALGLLLAGAANLIFLLAPLSEAWLRPADRVLWRQKVWGLGLGAVMAVPFLFPIYRTADLVSRLILGY